jgi:glycosyltransferase involved in cell wall biosynthesis
LQLPNDWDSALGKENVGLTAGVETDICNPEWINACNKMDLIIVPSNHSADCLRRSGTLTKPLLVVPEAYCSEISSVSQEQVDSLPRFSTNFNFLIFGQVTGDNPYNDRKNIFFTLKWLFEAFKGDQDVGIVIKTNVGRNTKIDKRRTMELMRSLVKECRRGEVFPKIHLVHGDLSDATVSALYRHPQIKALVTATRGEGFGLPILEAAASGLPVIATDWSGHTDFLKEGKFIQLNYNVKPVHPSRVDGRIFLPTSRWAEVLEEDFKKKTKKFRDSPSEPTRWASELANVVKRKYSLEAVYNHYDNVLGNLLC